MVNNGDTAWVLASAALVLLMTPGLAFFYGGLVRRKNVAGTIMHSFITIAVVSIVWILWGYSLGFGPDVGGFIGDLKYFGLRNVSAVEAGPYAETIPHQTFMIFQAMFAIITPALIAGAFAERIKFHPSSFLLFSGPQLCTLPWPTGSGVKADGWERTVGAPWTSPAAPWSTSTRDSPLWRRPSSSGDSKIRTRTDAAPQHPLCGAGGGIAVVRVVRV